MELGLKLWGLVRTPEAISAAAREAEAIGMDVVWTSETVSIDPNAGRRHQPGLDPWTMMAYVIGQTSTIKVGSAVAVSPLIHPLVLSSIIASLDRLSGGRVVVGLGSGYREEDFQALGLDFPTRGRLVRDQISVLRQFWDDSASGAVATESYSFDQLDVLQPITPGGPPLLIGGGSDFAIKRAAEYADGYIFPGTNMEAEQAKETTRTIEGLRKERGRTGAFQYWYQVTPLPDSVATIEEHIARAEAIGATGLTYQEPMADDGAEEVVAKMAALRQYLKH